MRTSPSTKTLWPRSCKRWPAAALLGATIFLLGALAGCEKTMRDMYDQPKYKPLAPSSLWPDEHASRPPLPDTIARSAGSFAGASSGRLGTTSPTTTPVDRIGGRHVADATSQGSPAKPATTASALTLTTLRRGQERFDIFCAPCHSIVGDGDGMIARRGFPHPPSFHLQRLREATDDYLYAIISDGHGIMSSYAERIDPPDRVAIVAYIRALQRSQHATLADVPLAERGQLSDTRR